MKKFIIKHYPFVLSIWQIIKAYRDVFIKKESYSQFGEDLFIDSILNNRDLSNGIYVDVGANHPTCLSNTYFFYKKGYSGLLIEPNKRLSRLLKKIRKRDIVLPIGIGKESNLLEYKYTTSHVLNTFSKNTDSEILKSEYIPLMPLDIVIESIFKKKWIYLLSIDVEGNDFEVLQGSLKILNQTFLIIIETNENEEKLKIEEFLNNNNFSKIKEIGCNLIFQNNSIILNDN